MKYSTSVKDFKAAFGIVRRVIPSKSPKPILMNAKFRVTEDGAELSATDLERGIRYPISGGTVIEPGSCMLPGDVTDKILKSADDSTLTIETDGLSVKVACGKAKWSVTTEDPDLFPEVPELTGEVQVTVAPADMVSLVDRTKHAVDLETTNYALGGMLVETTKDRVRMVATDGRRMAVQESPADVSSPVPKGSVIPAKLADLISALAKSVDQVVEFRFEAGHSVIARIGGSTIYGRLVEGRFPAWRDVFGVIEETSRFADLDPESFWSALDQVSVTSPDASTSGVTFQFTTGLLTLTSDGSELGSSEVAYPLDYEGSDLSGWYKPFHLMPALKSIGSERFTLSTGPKGLAVCLRTDSGYSFVSMGMTRAKP